MTLASRVSAEQQLDPQHPAVCSASTTGNAVLLTAAAVVAGVQQVGRSRHRLLPVVRFQGPVARSWHSGRSPRRVAPQRSLVSYSSSSFLSLLLRCGARLRSPLSVLFIETERLQKGCSRSSPRWRDLYTLKGDWSLSVPTLPQSLVALPFLVSGSPVGPLHLPPCSSRRSTQPQPERTAKASPLGARRGRLV